MTQTVQSQIEDRLAGIGARYTSGRQTVVDALSRSEGPRSAAELFEELGHHVPLSSLYRSLGVLEEAGIVAPHHGDVTRYELAEWLAGHHHHLVCIDCGTVDDVELPPGLESVLQQVIKGATDRSAFRASGHTLEIDGVCERCA